MCCVFMLTSYFLSINCQMVIVLSSFCNDLWKLHYQMQRINICSFYRIITFRRCYYQKRMFFLHRTKRIELYFKSLFQFHLYPSQIFLTMTRREYFKNSTELVLFLRYITKVSDTQEQSFLLINQHKDANSMLLLPSPQITKQ